MASLTPCYSFELAIQSWASNAIDYTNFGTTADCQVLLCPKICVKATTAPPQLLESFCPKSYFAPRIHFRAFACGLPRLAGARLAMTRKAASFQKDSKHCGGAEKLTTPHAVGFFKKTNTKAKDSRICDEKSLFCEPRKEIRLMVYRRSAAKQSKIYRAKPNPSTKLPQRLR